MIRRPPTLPQHDPDPARRAAALARARDAYAYDYSYQSLPFVKDLPAAEDFGPRYMAHGALGGARVKENRAAYAAAVRPVEPDLARARSLGDFDAMIRTLEAPAAQGLWRDDDAFAWQRVAGAVPTAIRGIDRLPDHFPVTQAHFARALGDGDSLDAARAEGRLFLCDYAVFDGAPCGRYPPRAKDGLPKHLPAPLALFCAVPGSRAGLRPVAIQCGQRPGPEQPIYTPADGMRWALARLAVQVADANLEGIVVHFGHTHLVPQAIILAARRCLSEDHPVLRLLAPHFEFTLAANQYARKALVAPDGVQERVLAPTLPATHEILRAAVRAVHYDDLDPTLDARRRGVDRRDALPVYPFRDDGEAVWGAIVRWVDDYLALYYPGDAEAAADVELRAMLDELRSPDGGRVPRLVEGASTETRADIAALVARVIYRVSAYHAAINYNWWPWMGYAPNAPSVIVAPVPGPGEVADEAALLAMMPPLGAAWETIAQIYGVAAIAANRLGEYPDGFDDPRVAPRRDAFARALEAVEAAVIARDAGRFAPYTCMRPSRVTASVNS